MTGILYSLGYEKRTIGEYIAILCENAIDIVVDVRETAWSHKPGFSKAALQSALAAAAIDYVHAPFAGNPKWLRSNASSHAECLDWYSWYVTEFDEILPAFEALIGSWVAGGKRVCITCFERHSDDCHRAILASKWQERGQRRVEHLATAGCARLLTN